MSWPDLRNSFDWGRNLQSCNLSTLKALALHCSRTIRICNLGNPLQQEAKANLPAMSPVRVLTSASLVRPCPQYSWDCPEEIPEKNRPYSIAGEIRFLRSHFFKRCLTGCPLAFLGWKRGAELRVEEKIVFSRSFSLLT